MTIVVTGAASGIGLATAKLLKSNGHDVVLWDINEADLHKHAEVLSSHYSVVDVTNYQQLCTALGNITQLDAVIHCAGIAHVGLFDELSIEQHQRVIQVNLMGTINIAHATIPQLKQTKGSLILLASSSSFYGPPDFASYGATKAGVVRFAEAIRLELEEHRIHVGVIAPHFVQTPMLDESKKSSMFEGASYTSTADEIAQSIEAMLRQRKSIAVPGIMNKLNYFLSRHLPQIGPIIVRAIWQQGKNKRGRS